MTRSKIKKQYSCHIAYTSKKVHNILKEGFNNSPMFTGRIKGKGPECCPSIEDKIEDFQKKKGINFLLPDRGKETIEIYLNGFSTSLPEDIQLKALREIKNS